MKHFVIYIATFACILLSGCTGCAGPQSEPELDWITEDSTSVYLDTTTVSHESEIQEEQKDLVPTTTYPSHSSYYDTEEYQERKAKHRGTPPDDGFGFDYYDDEDDEWNVERNQYDAYPDESDW